jgi:hypothetical protein
MSFDVETLYKLMPAIYRIRDGEQGDSLEAVLSGVIRQELPLKALLSVIAEQIAILEEDLAQLYDDQFIETCADWVIPYIGDSVGYHTLHGVTSETRSPRADVANSLHYRRRKGTAAMLEPLVRSVTGWHVRVVEFFQLLAATQRMNHLRPDNRATVDMRDGVALQNLNSPFDSLAHSVDVQRIASGRGRYNVPNVGVFVWRLKVYSLTFSPTFQLDGRRYLFSPLGQDTQLYTLPNEIETSFFAEPVNLPLPISRRVLHSHLEDYYGIDKSITLAIDDQFIDASDIIVHDLSNREDGGWAHMPEGEKIALDPVLGRIAFPRHQEKPIYVTYHYPFSTDAGGGEYERLASFTTELEAIQQVSESQADIQAALDALDGDGIVEIIDNGRYGWPPAFHAQAASHIELRASDRHRPILEPTSIATDPPAQDGNKQEQQGPTMEPVDEETVPEMVISGDEGAEVTLNGFLINGGTLRVQGQLKRLSLRHCTLVPGLTLLKKGIADTYPQLSLIVESNNTSVEIDHCIVGGVRIVKSASVSIANSIIDATVNESVAFAAPADELAPGGSLRIMNSTIIGRVSTASLESASNSIFTQPAFVERIQEGCVRYSYLPLASRAPRRYKCQPKTEADEGCVKPLFTSLRYGDPGYCQLSLRCAPEIRQGADDEAEMGAFHDLYQSQRDTNVRLRLNEYLRFGLEAGIFYAT